MSAQPRILTLWKAYGSSKRTLKGEGGKRVKGETSQCIVTSVPMVLFSDIWLVLMVCYWGLLVL